MSSMSNIRESSDTKLAKLDARADAFQAALEGSANQIDDRIARNKQEVRRALDKLTADIDQRRARIFVVSKCFLEYYMRPLRSLR